ncbi:MAG: hypothetical protein KDK04_21850, partial [Candidatus Competibacteraceae bacterium]|nr:hypothetical protein [Candidatus Competibacteraceae bacterium]
MSGQLHLSIRQLQRFFQTHWQLHFSLGAISQAQGKFNPWLEPILSPDRHARAPSRYRPCR